MSTRLFVGNLPYNATEADLREHFGAIGPLSYVYLPTDRETGKPRGFAFVEFIERAQAEEAIRRLNNQLFMGRPIAVNEARAKDQQSSPRPQITPRPASAPPVASERNFGPDDAPRRTRKQPKSAAKTQRVPKGPIRERTSGPVSFGNDDDEDSFYDDPGEENFASSAGLSEDEIRNEEL